MDLPSRRSIRLDWFQRKDERCSILSKITGLVLAALAAQMILTGIRHFFSGESS